MIHCFMFSGGFPKNIFILISFISIINIIYTEIAEKDATSSTHHEVHYHAINCCLVEILDIIKLWQVVL